MMGKEKEKVSSDDRCSTFDPLSKELTRRSKRSPVGHSF